MSADASLSRHSSHDAVPDQAAAALARPSEAAHAPGTGSPAVARQIREALLSGPARWALGLLLPLSLLAVWQLLSSAGVFSFVQLPPPLAVIEAAFELVERGDLWLNIAISVQRVLLGFCAGALLGLVLGSLVGLSRFADVLIAPTIGAFRAVPSLAWVPLLLLWIGLGEDSKVTLIAIGAFFPVYTTLGGALRHVDAHLVEVARSFGYTGFRLLLTVQLPAVVPSIFSGLRLALAQAWLFLVAAELLGASMGLGFLLTDSQNNGRTDRLLLAIVLLAVLGTVTDAILGWLEKRATARWSA